MKISNEESAAMAGSLAWAQLVGVTPPSVATLKRFLQQPFSSEAMLLMAAVQHNGFMTDELQQVLRHLTQLRETDYSPPPLITGDDLTRIGASPGPKFKLALSAAYDAQLEGSIQTHAEAMRIALQTLQPAQ